MKRFPLFLLLFLAITMSKSLPLQGQTIPHITLREGEQQALVEWQLAAIDDTLQLAVQLPSVVQDELIKVGKLAEPYYRTNENEIQWVDKHDWVYTTSFYLDSAQLNAPHLHHLLECHGIDTFADIYLNGEHIAQTDNMFRQYNLNVGHSLRAGLNILSIQLHSPSKYPLAQFLSNGFNYPADNDHAPIRLSPFTRKAPYHYGWDWGMRLLSMGIYRPIYLSTYRHSKLENLYIQTDIAWSETESQAQSAKLTIEPEWAELGSKEDLRLNIHLYDEQGQVVAVSDGQSASRPIVLRIEQPQLWWPNGWGKAYLYRLEADVMDQEGRPIQRISKRIGIRDIELVNEADEHGTSFYFSVNKRPLFARGANYVPSETLLVRRSKEELERLFKDALFANFNMIRVWGGGVYEEDRFYDLADEHGILIWQDFMFACTAYPSDNAFLTNVGLEARDQIRRLRHHPSIALWCGNNEVEEAIKYWGWQRKYSPEVYQQMSDSYAPLFHSLLPGQVARYDKERQYIHSSPMQANWGRPHSFLHGDIHYWGLWYGKQDFSVFSEYPMRFVSEFGFQAFPSMSSIARFAIPEDYSLDSPVMRLHQKASTGNGLIKEYMARNYRVPERFEDFVYVSQILQARGMAEAIQAQRKHSPICMGSLYWQFNDSWPAVSWSSVDYYGEYKALHYALRDAYAPQNLILTQGNTKNDLELYLVNNALDSYQVKQIEIQAYHIPSGTYRRQTLRLNTHVGPGALARLAQLSISQLVEQDDPAQTIITVEHIADKSHRLRAEWSSTAIKDLDLPPAQYEVKYKFVDNGRAGFYLKAKGLLKDLFFSLPWSGARFSDNLFDLLPNESIYVEVTHPNISKKMTLPLTIETMNNIHQRC